MSVSQILAAYDADAAVLAERYEAFPFEAVHAPLLGLVRRDPMLILDVGAGSGRDAAWLAERGHTVIAVEPSVGMREEAVRRHPHSGIRWVDDRLPGLEKVHRLGLAFDLILLSAVWMHVAPDDRSRAFRKLITLLKPGGRIVISLRHGAPDPQRPMHPAPRAEIERLAGEHGATVTHGAQAADLQGRGNVTWETVSVELADDGTGALPLIRHIVLNDAKSSTYKLALLRTVSRAADASPGLAIIREDGAVDLPLGLIALYWLRGFLPLVAADLPQTPSSRNGDGLGFVKEPFRRLAGISPFELRVGAHFHGEVASAVLGALRDAARTIAQMPAHYITYPGSERQVFEAAMGRSGKRGSQSLLLDADLLWSFGTFRMPVNIWQALTRLNAWVEPALVAEWIRLMQRYLAGQGRAIAEDVIRSALAWLDPIRDTQEARQIAASLLQSGEDLQCVWTARRLGRDSFDIDHCLPFSAWPCADLWNLMPAASRVNRHDKVDRLVSASLLDAARDRIAAWWDRAYLRWSEVLAERFRREAAASLPILVEDPQSIEPDDVLDGLAVKRLMLKVTQQMPEWNGHPRR